MIAGQMFVTGCRRYSVVKFQILFETRRRIALRVACRPNVRPDVRG